MLKYFKLNTLTDGITRIIVECLESLDGLDAIIYVYFMVLKSIVPKLKKYYRYHHILLLK